MLLVNNIQNIQKARIEKEGPYMLICYLSILTSRIIIKSTQKNFLLPLYPRSL